MKKLIFLISIFSFQLVHAQTENEFEKKKEKKFIATIKTTDGMVTKGEITGINENSIHIKNLSSYSFNQVQTISVKRKNSVLRGVLIGLGAGVVSGVLIGIASGDDKQQPYYSYGQDPTGLGNFFVTIENSFAMSAGEKALYGGIGLGVTGAITGAIIGAVAKKKFIIGGKKEKYRDLNDHLMKRLIVK